MAGEKDARVSIGIDGVEDVTGAADRVKNAWSSVGGSIQSAVGGAVSSVGQSMANLGQTALHVATAMGTINLQAGLESAKRLNEEMGRMAVVTGASVAALGSRFEALSKQTLLGEPELQKLSQGLGKITHDFSGAIEAQKGLGEEAIATGRSAQEMQALGATLHNVLGVTGDTTEALGMIRAQAEALGTVGGAAAFQEQLVAVGGALSQVAVGSEDARNRLTAFLGVVGHGLGPQAAQRAQAGALGAIQSHAQDISRNLGYDILDEQGHVRDPAKVIQDLKRSLDRRGLNQQDQLLAFRRFAGAEAGSRLFYGDFSEGNLEGLASVKPSRVAADQAAGFAASTEGQRVARSLAVQRDQRAAAAPLLGAQDAWDEFFQGSPVAKLLASQVLMGAASSLLKGTPGFVSSLLGGGSAAAAGAGGGSVAGATAEVGAAAATAKTGLSGLVSSLSGLSSIAAPVAVGLAGIAAQGKVLVELGEASKAKQGFENKALSRGEAEDLAGKARRAEAEGKKIRELDAVNVESVAASAQRSAQRDADRQKVMAVIRERGAEGVTDYIRGQDPELFKRIRGDQGFSQLIDAMRNQKVEVTIRNASGSPIEVVNADRAQGKGRN